jgi:hypothetical protein
MFFPVSSLTAIGPHQVGRGFVFVMACLLL